MLSGLFTLRYSIAFTSTKLDLEGKREALIELRWRQLKLGIWILVWIIAFCFALVVVQQCYGVYTNGYVVLFAVPATCIFCIILLVNKILVLEDHYLTLKEDLSDELSLDTEYTG